MDGYCYASGDKITEEELLEKVKRYVDNIEWEKVVMIWTAG